MDKMKYIIGTALHNPDPSFSGIWRGNTLKYSWDIYCVSTEPPSVFGVGRTIGVNHNLGHVNDLIAENRDGLCGWSAHMITLAMLAYSAGKHFVYKESDCIWHGPVLEQMRADMGDKDFVFGRKMTSPPHMDCSQSTFMVRHSFIPTFVSMYLSYGDDRLLLPEHKFSKIEEELPQHCARLSFGVDRCRPIPYDEPLWFVQQLSDFEILEMKNKGLI